MKPIEILNPDPINKPIDWDVPQWLVHKEEKDLIVLSTGGHKAGTFAGTALPCEHYISGEFSNGWNKHEFIPINKPLTIEISN